MRSRYSAFALGLGSYLVETLSEDHADRSLAADELARVLGRAKDHQRFMGLEILSSSGGEDAPLGAIGTVHFVARVFERGVDCSFSECSTFVRTEHGWRYQSGEVEPVPPSRDLRNRA
jgi:SEC-C motif-containing protein